MENGFEYITIFSVYIISFVIIFFLYGFIQSKVNVMRRRIIIGGIIFIIAIIAYLLIANSGLVSDEFHRQNNLFSRGAMTIIWVSGAFLLNNLVSFFLWDGIFAEDGRSKIPRVLTICFSIVLYLVIFSIMLAVVYDESPVAIVASSSLLALVIGLSARSTLSQIFSGLAINFAGNIKKGDYIRLQRSGIFGRVAEIGWRSVSVLKNTKDMAIVPNNVMTSEIVENFSRPKKNMFRIKLKFFTSAASYPDQVSQLVEAACMDYPYIVKDVGCKVLLKEFTKARNEYQLRLYCVLPPMATVVAAIRTLIYYKLKRHGIELAFDGGYNYSQEYKEISFNDMVEKIDKQTISDFVKNNKILSVLSEQEIATLVDNSKYEKYFKPESVITEGDKNGRSLFIVLTGELKAYKQATEEGRQAELRSFVPGEVFGIKAALLGKPRRITVRAMLPSIVLEITETTIATLLKNNTQLVDKLSAALTEREMKSMDTINAYKDQLASDREKKRMLDKFVNKIKELFSIS